MSEKDDLQALAGEYVLGLLEPAEADDVERRMTTDTALRGAVAGWRDRFVEIDAAAAPVAPSTELWRRIADDVAAPHARQIKAAKRPSLWSSIGFWRGATFAGAALSALLAIFSGILVQQMQPRPIAVAVLQSDDASPGAIIEAFADGSVRLVPLRAIDVPAGRALQV
jgi:anti-sigma-K factor RskA